MSTEKRETIDRLLAAARDVIDSSAKLGLHAAISLHGPIGSVEGKSEAFFVVCHPGGEHAYCESVRLGPSVTVLLSRPATAEEIERMAACKREIATHSCKKT